MVSFSSDDPIWKILAAIDDEPTGEFSELVKVAQLDPKVDFRNAFLVNLSLKGADLSGFDFSGSDLRGTGLRYAAKSQGVIISEATRLDPADQKWWGGADFADMSHDLSQLYAVQVPQVASILGTISDAQTMWRICPRATRSSTSCAVSRVVAGIVTAPNFIAASIVSQSGGVFPSITRTRSPRHTPKRRK